MSVRVDDRVSECPLVSVTCRRCSAAVSVRKSSWNQTSVQWNSDASVRCLERRPAENIAAYSNRGVFLTCSALSASIVQAASSGSVRVIDEVD